MTWGRAELHTQFTDTCSWVSSVSSQLSPIDFYMKLIGPYMITWPQSSMGTPVEALLRPPSAVPPYVIIWQWDLASKMNTTKDFLEKLNIQMYCIFLMLKLETPNSSTVGRDAFLDRTRSFTDCKGILGVGVYLHLFYRVRAGGTPTWRAAGLGPKAKAKRVSVCFKVIIK